MKKFELNRTTLLEKIRDKMNVDIHIDFCGDFPTLKRLLYILYNNDYNFVGEKKRYDIEKPTDELRYEILYDWRFYFHGNSKPILHAFYNNITRKNELQWTTRSIAKTYPQYKNLKVYYFFG